MPDTVPKFWGTKFFFFKYPPPKKKMAAKSAIIHMNTYSISKKVQAIFIDGTKNVPVPVCTYVKKYKSGEWNELSI